MLKKLLPFEIQLQTRQIGFWVTVIIMFALGLLTMSVDWVSISLEGGERVKNNGANTVAIQTAVLSMAVLLFSGVFVVTGIMRDEIHKMTEIMHAAPVKNRDIISARLIGVILASFLCLFAASAGLFTGQFMPWLDKETIGPVNVLYFIYPLLLFSLVNAVFVSVILTAIAGLTRNRMMVYVSAIALFMLYNIMGIFVDDAPKWVASLLGPFGANALGLETQYWPADQQNTQMVSLMNYVGLNRLLWLGVSVGAYIWASNLFKRGIISGKVKTATPKALSPYKLPPRDNIEPVFTFTQSLQSLWQRFGFEYLTTARSRAFLILTLLAVFMTVIVIIVGMYFDPSPTLPTSLKMAQLSTNGFGLSLLLVIIFFSGEMAWRDRLAHMNEIIDAGPVRNWHLLAGKWLALPAIILTLIATALIVGMIAQLILGAAHINFLTYFKIGFVSLAPSFILLCWLALFVQTFMPNRIVGMFAAAGVIIFINMVLGNLPFFHPIMDYGTVSPGKYSEINGYNNLIRFRWFGTYWTALAGLFALIATWLWRRGNQTGLLKRFARIGQNLSLPTAVAACIFAAIFTGTGFQIYKAYDRANYRNSKARELRTANYEKLLFEKASAALPKVRTIHADIDFRPSKQTALIGGHYTFENVTGAPLEELFVGLATTHVENIKKLSVLGAARRTEGDHIDDYEDYGYWVFDFDPPLAAGASATMEFETFFHAPRLADGSRILRNGTFVNNGQVMPTLGITKNWLTNPDKRRKHDLPKRRKRAAQDDMIARQNNFFGPQADYVEFSAHVCTDPGQIPIAPGQRISDETKDVDGAARYCRNYKAVKPIMAFVSFLSGNYVDQREKWEGPNGRNIDLTIYHHRQHDYNVDLMLKAMQNSLRLYTQKFSSYPYHQVRMMEFPYASFAQSFASTIPFSENIGFVLDPGKPDDPKSIDLATYVTMHELGHQWFGHQIVPANTKGFNVLSEGLTEYAALSAYEDMYGWKRARRLMEKRPITQYLTSRATDKNPEPSLMNAEDQSYLFYHKANWVFWGMKQYIGEEKIQSAVKTLMDEYGYKGPPYPTTFELISELRKAAGDEFQLLITDYWERITFWELSFPSEVTTTEADGKYNINFTVKIDKKIASEESGKETSVTNIPGDDLYEWVEIGFYSGNPKKTLGGDWQMIKRVHLTKEETPLTFALDEKPAFIVLDPRRLLIERNIDDNVKKVSAKLVGKRAEK